MVNRSAKNVDLVAEICRWTFFSLPSEETKVKLEFKPDPYGRWLTSGRVKPYKLVALSITYLMSMRMIS